MSAQSATKPQELPVSTQSLLQRRQHYQLNIPDDFCVSTQRLVVV